MYLSCVLPWSDHTSGLHTSFHFFFYTSRRVTWIGEKKKWDVFQAECFFCLTFKDFPLSVFLICVFRILSWGQQELWGWFNSGGVKQDEEKKLFPYSQILRLVHLRVSNSTLFLPHHFQVLCLIFHLVPRHFPYHLRSEVLRRHFSCVFSKIHKVIIHSTKKAFVASLLCTLP